LRFSGVLINLSIRFSILRQDGGTIQQLQCKLLYFYVSVKYRFITTQRATGAAYVLICISAPPMAASDHSDRERNRAILA